MFLGIKKNNKNNRALTFLENLVFFEKPERVILFGSKPKELTRLSEDFLTALNARGLQTEYIHISDIINQPSYYLEKKNIFVLDGLFESVNLNEDQKENLKTFLSIYQHHNILVTCSLNPDEVFSNEVRDFLDDGTTWSRNFLGCKQLFMDDQDRNKFLSYLKQQPQGDYRIIQSLEFLSENVTPYDELDFLNKSMIKEVFKKGKDVHNTCIILTDELKPSLKLIPFKDRKLYKSAVRLESFIAGTGYVGVELSNEEINKYYRLLLEGYNNFLTTGKEVFMDVSLENNKTDLDIVLEIKKRALTSR
ncbi:hypothetical protein IQ283_22590 [Alkalihalobacillus hwajinpoensis]|uniref:hypothetical protein n=1 Tax=Guptibacillus hwajinpoensis TaxID=208199 RepID=UPI00188428C1|nr:hypothetical protein [Pseudalkalibacillus hwajinpoensis]MBF0709389.1 hypothetical protein [Pseudalkalibacillus hwajinpoensis]